MPMVSYDEEIIDMLDNVHYSLPFIFINSLDIIATVLAVEPMRFIYRGRIAVFSIKVLRDERVCVIAEQRPDCSEEESFQWMSRVLQAVDSIHQVGIFCLALVPPNHLPKTPLGTILSILLIVFGKISIPALMLVQFQYFHSYYLLFQVASICAKQEDDFWKVHYILPMF